MKILWQDAIVVLALIFHFGAAFSTYYIIGTLEQLTSVAENVEIDPIAKVAINFQYGLFIITGISQGTLLACFWYIRKKVLKKQIDMFFLNAFTFIVFYMFAKDFIGNFGIWARIFFG